MPKKTRPPEVVEEVRKEILDRALEIIAEEGFYGMSMRKLAEGLGIAAKTIYNYFCSKEEIYLCVLTRGFEILVERIGASCDGIEDPIERLRAMCAAYVAFGLENINYYNIMFDWDVPKYRDYQGTVMEPIAAAERKKAFELVSLAQKALVAAGPGRGEGRADLKYRALKLWTELHGAISLCNSHGLHELYEKPDELVGKFIEDAIRPFVTHR
jgi:AcrR family transcriptional regulator